MKSCLRSLRVRYFVPSLVCGVLCPLATAQLSTPSTQLAIELIDDGQVSFGSSPPLGEHVVRARWAGIPAGLVAGIGSGQAVSFDLFADASVTGEITRRRDRLQGIPGTRFTLCGSLDTEPPGSFVLGVNEHIVVGQVRSPAGVYRIRYGSDGRSFIEQIDAGTLPVCELPAAMPPPVASQTPQGENDGAAHPTAHPTEGTDEGSVIDVLAVYTPTVSFLHGGPMAIVAEVDVMIADSNEAYINSNILLEANLVHVQQIDYDESGNHLTLLTNPSDGVMDDAHVLRDAYGADLVALIRSGGGGSAWGLSELTPSFATMAFSQNGIDSAPGMVLAHEMGHNLGACHAIGDGGGCSVGLLFPFSNGHRFNGDSGTLWRTVMAYSPGTGITHFSNPWIAYDGQATGRSEFGPDGANNWRTIEEGRFHVASYRTSDGICEALDLPSVGFSDCNENGVPDACDLARGDSLDVNDNGIPDDCECFIDTNGDGIVDENDCVNDDCGDAVVVAAGVVVFDSGFATTDGPPEGLCQATGSSLAGSDIWYRYHSPCDGDLTIELCGSSFDTQLVIYENHCPVGANHAIACSDDDSCGNQASVTFEAAATTDYLIRVGGHDAASGPGIMMIVPAICVVNDPCGNAILIDTGNAEFTTVGATTDGPADTLCNAGDPGQIESDVWFRYEPTCTGQATISVCDADFDTALAVYGESCPFAGEEILACNDDACGDQSSLTLAVTGGAAYRIRIGSYDDSQGSGVLTITCDNGCPTDTNGDGKTDVVDLINILLNWGNGGTGDVDGDGTVDEDDLGEIIPGWGDCE